MVAAEERSAVNVYHETAAERAKRLNENYERSRPGKPDYLSDMKAAREEKARQQATRDDGIRAYVKKDTGTFFITNTRNVADRSDLTEVDIRLAPIATVPKYKNRTIESYGTSDINELVKIYSKKYGLKEKLVLALIKAESNFNVRAKSPKGACGLMQLMPGTASDMGVTNIFDPAQNIAGGTQYLAKMLEIFNGDVQLALAAYNAGPGAVKKYGGVPPYEETRKYVRSIVADYKGLTSGKASLVVPVSSKTARREKPRENNGYYTVHFKSGLVQPANIVRDRDDEWYELQWRDKAWPVKKDLVKEIIAPS